MGCDIHLGIEYKTDLNSSWHSGASDLDVGRNYELFGYLAGVRESSIESLSDPRGWPKDPPYGIDYDKLDWVGEHTPSWLLARELNKLPLRFRKMPWYKCVKAFADEYGNNCVRIVFNFDS